MSLNEVDERRAVGRELAGSKLASALMRRQLTAIAAKAKCPGSASLKVFTTNFRKRDWGW